jgi:ABC-type branched-subunit amino acid transport system ATPase component
MMTPDRPGIEGKDKAESLLEVDRLSVHFGAVRACDEIGLNVGSSQIVGIAGPNGSGKSTLLAAICGAVPIRGGQVRWRGTDITGWSTSRTARAGLVRTFQQPSLFASTVGEAIKTAVECSRGLWATRRRREAARLPDSAAELLAFAGLSDLGDAMCGSLPAGLLRKVGVVLALAVQPSMLLLDEPAAGLNDDESASLAQLLFATRDAGTTIVVVDHDMGFLFPLVDRMIVLDAGKVLSEGAPHEISSDPKVIEVYLGKRFAQSAAGPTDEVSNDVL